MSFRLLLLSFFSLCLVACSDPNKQATLDYGPAQARDRIVSHQDPLADLYLDQVKPVLENRCVVCHGCYDAPCQLKLSSPEGIDRGFSPEQVYGTRFHEAQPTRLFIDYQSTSEWRNQGYQSVLNERDPSPQANLDQSVLYQLLSQKIAQPLPVTPILSEDDFDFSLTREQTCPDIYSIADYKKKQPLGGMPYGLPQLEESEFNTLKEWIALGSPMAQPKALSAAMLKEVAQWETVFNGKDNKSRLVTRYIYEHLFLGNLHFSDLPLDKAEQPVFFRMVRSFTPPGKPIQEIATRRPYDDPQVKEFYYRLRQVTSTIVTKVHLPYALNEKRLARWNALFYKAPFTVEFLAGYKNSSNPFKNFAAIPADARYQFMLDEAEFSIMGFIKGPVCRGQTALNVIHDKFWVFFSDPRYIADAGYANFIYSQADNLELPSDYSATHFATTSWDKYAKREKAFVQAQKNALKGSLDAQNLIGIGNLYKDASLTIFRNSDSAVVVDGLQGQAPKTAWIINYPILERIHYLLVAGYDVYGSIRHQLVTRLYMDFLRIESEMAFITFLPKEQRLAEMQDWYQDSTDDLEEYLVENNFYLNQANSIEYKTADAKQELFDMLKAKYAIKAPAQLDILNHPLSGINQLPNPAVQQLAPASFVIVEEKGKATELYTILRHNAHSNVSTLLYESKTRLPKQDTSEVFLGLLSSYPQVIFKITAQQQTDFVAALTAVNSAQDYQALLTQYAVRRTDEDFWPVSDQLHHVHQQKNSVKYGLFDYNRLENR